MEITTYFARFLRHTGAYVRSMWAKARTAMTVFVCDIKTELSDVFAHCLSFTFYTVTKSVHTEELSQICVVSNSVVYNIDTLFQDAFL